MKARVSLLMVVILGVVLLTASAQATSPSITTNDLSRVVWYEVVETIATTTTNAASTVRRTTTGTRIPDEPVPLAGDFTISIVNNTQEVINELNKLSAFMQEKGLPVIDYFDFSTGNQNGELKAKITRLLPAGFDPDTLVMYEFVTVEPFFYDGKIGDVLTSFEFPTEYREGQVAVAVIGIFDDNGNVEWVPLKAEAVKEADGVVRMQITFTEEALVKAGEKPFALAILGE